MKKLFAPLLLWVFTFPLFGQSNYAGLTGSVTDGQNLPIQGATIEIKAATTGATRHVTTNEHGLFEAAALLPDDYELKTEAPSFATATQT